jgi:hypothetical protein
MEVKLLLAYNIRPNREAEYYRYVLGEFLPSLQNMDLMMIEGWHTAFGDYPMRLIVLQADDDLKLRTIMQSEQWHTGKERLLKLVRDYEERVVPAKQVFQFFIPSKR